MFIDIHSHILHGVDDGAKTIEESIELLKQEKEQGVTAVVCTPHFYPEYMALEEHINSTNKAFNELKEATRSLDLPQLFLGHEVQCYPQIARSSGLEFCTISSSYYMLLELPFITAIPKETVREIIRLSDDLGFRIIIAHIERYCYDRQYKNIVSISLSQNPVFQLLLFSPCNSLPLESITYISPIITNKKTILNLIEFSKSTSKLA